jgi:hypothetical protein
MTKRMSYGAALASALFLFAHPLHADTCRLGPLHCNGNPNCRAILPGCSAVCGPKETPFCVPGTCLCTGNYPWHRHNACNCNTSYFPSPR